MSKDIDTSQGLEGLSDDDLMYLAARDNQEAANLLNERGTSVDLSVGRPLEEIANTGDANTAGETIEQLEARLEAMKAEQGSGEDDEEEEGLDPDSYESATNDDLRSEIVRRNESRDEADQLSLEGRKADLVATLEADDAENQE